MAIIWLELPLKSQIKNQGYSRHQYSILQTSKLVIFANKRANLQIVQAAGRFGSADTARRLFRFMYKLDQKFIQRGALFSFLFMGYYENSAFYDMCVWF